MSNLVINLLVVAGSTLVIYLFVTISMRIFGRRQMMQLTALDLLMIMLLGSAVETAMVHGDASLKAGLVSGSVLFLANWLVSHWVRRSKKVARMIGIGPVLLVHDGKLINDHLRRYGLTREDVFQAIRQREFADLEQVRFAILEPDGEISVVPRERI